LAKKGHTVWGSNRGHIKDFVKSVEITGFPWGANIWAGNDVKITGRLGNTERKREKLGKD